MKSELNIQPNLIKLLAIQLRFCLSNVVKLPVSDRTDFSELCFANILGMLMVIRPSLLGNIHIPSACLLFAFALCVT